MKNFFLRFYILVLGSFFNLGSTFAQEVTENGEEFVDVNTSLGTGSVDFTWLFLKTLLAMVVVLGLAVLILRFVFPRLSLHRPKGGGSSIQILERFPLDAKKTLYRIQVEDQEFLIGGSEHNLNLIAELNLESREPKNP